MAGVKIRIFFVSAVLLWPEVVFAADAATSSSPAVAAPSAEHMSPFQFILGSVQFFLIAFFIYFWMAIRPEQLKSDERRKFVAGLKKNDDVMTSGGIFGKVIQVKDESVTLDIGGNVKLRVHTDHVIAPPPAAPGNEGHRLQNHIQKASEQ